MLLHLQFFAFLELLLFEPLKLPFLNLLDNNECALPLRIFAFLLDLLFMLDILQPFNFHHDVEPAVLFSVLVLESLLLLELLIPDGDALRVEDHLVHRLNVVLLLVKDLLGHREHADLLLLILDFELVRREFVVALFVHLVHAFDPRVVKGLLRFLLALHELGLLFLLLFRHYYAGLPDSVDFGLRQDHGVALQPLHGVLTYSPQLVDGEDRRASFRHLRLALA
mmetsp:Transcript_22904/g.26270  ORF Transcript_22904/g.26270 Transcript_22904/m.26270 type:complete len:224 (-) Transcript_22904:105-776(-)